MCETYQSGTKCRGLFKNLRKDGLYYWVETEIAPVRNKYHETVGYIAARKPVSRENIEEATKQYKKLIESER
jgi:aerotaxis receptor